MNRPRNSPAGTPPRRSDGLLGGIARDKVVLAGIVVAALFARAYGARFGLPQLYYWDEPTVVNRAVRFGSGDLNPHFFYYPTLYMYVLFGVSGLYYVFGRLLGHFGSSQDFAVEYFTNPSGVYTCARLATAAVGAATVVVAYQVGRRFFGKTAGLLAAAILAVSVLHASYSHVAITDVPQAFFMAAAYVPIHGIMTRSRPRDYVLAGALIGLGTATKYLAILLVPTLIAAHLLRRTRSAASGWSVRGLASEAIAPKLWLSFCALGAAFFLASPYNVLSVREFLRDYSNQVSLSGGGAEKHGSLFFLDVLSSDFGWPVCVAVATGLVVLLWKPSREEIVFLTFPVLYFVTIARLTKVFPRYMIPEDPFVAVVAGVGIVAAARSLPLRFTTVAITGAACVACAFPAVAILRWDALMAAAVDTRTAALRWAESTLPNGTAVAIEPFYDRIYFNAPLLTDVALEKLNRDIPAGGRFAPVRERVFATLQSRPVFRLAPWVEDLDGLASKGVKYVFISAACGPLGARFADQLKERATVVQVFSPDAAQVRGLSVWPDVFAVMPPEITVYAVR